MQADLCTTHKTAKFVIPLCKKSKSLFYVGEVTIVLAQAGIQTSSPPKRGTSSFIPGFRIALRLSGMTVLMIFVIVQSSQADSTRLH
jgi:hypothetical protein